MYIRNHRISKRTAIWSVIYATVSGLVLWATYMEWDGLRNMHLLGYDYVFFYHAFQVIHQHQIAAALYNLQAQHHLLLKLHYPIIHFNQYVYPPQFALLLAPLAYVSFHLSQVIWSLMSAGLYGVAIFLNLRMLWEHIDIKLKTVTILLLIISTPFQIDVGVGNVNTILFTTVTFCFYLLYKQNKPWWAGVPLAIAILIKVTPGVIVLYLLLRRQWRTSLSAAVTVAIISFVTAARLGWHALFMYAADFVTFGKTSEKHGPAPYNQSLKGVLGAFYQHHWLDWTPHTQSLLFFGFVAIAMTTILLTVWRAQKIDWRLDYALATLTPLIFSPLVEEMHMILAIPSILCLISLLPATKTRLYRHNDRGQDVDGDDLSTSYDPHTEASRNGGLHFHGVIRNLGRFVPAVTGIVSLIILSLPITFMLNDFVSHWPQLFWLHTQMFWVLIGVFAMIIWRIRQTRDFGRP